LPPLPLLIIVIIILTAAAAVAVWISCAFTDLTAAYIRFETKLALGCWDATSIRWARVAFTEGAEIWTWSCLASVDTTLIKADLWWAFAAFTDGTTIRIS